MPAYFAASLLNPVALSSYPNFVLVRMTQIRIAKSIARGMASVTVELLAKSVLSPAFGMSAFLPCMLSFSVYGLAGSLTFLLDRTMLVR